MELFFFAKQTNIQRDKTGMPLKARNEGHASALDVVT